ncbi:hypothetical protein KIL84_018407 [Mauremys mutica]|uniref:HTH CENPB-type domain-containing protein n=1 Tax=Mauremys mutica TaxID=74926 RepID=A0A9D3XT57_9SAUR|nr:hypothetical protein KIL84_018407 [Mauremys mutica]
MAGRKDPIMAPARRRKFEASFKLKVVNFAKEHNCAAASQYGVTEKMARDWKANEDALKSMPGSKCALRRGTPHWSELEKHITDMVHEHRQNGYVVTQNKIRMFALQWAKSNPDHSKGFKATVSWRTRFLERHNLVLRQKTRIAQKLPADLDGKGREKGSGRATGLERANSAAAAASSNRTEPLPGLPGHDRERHNFGPTGTSAGGGGTDEPPPR